MSRSKEPEPLEDAWEKRKEDKNKKKKSKKERKEVPPDTNQEYVDSDTNLSKKRKREVLPDKIEVNVDLPEPLSKKEARKAKKSKANPPTVADATTTPQSSGDSVDEKKTVQRSEYGVWIGNLPWSATKDSLRTFLTEKSEITAEQITRVHLPPPTKPLNPRWTTKPLNKGFAYVDFSTQLAMFAAIALTETLMDGRALLIKNAKNFEGRPEKPKAEETGEDNSAGAGGKGAHPPNKRVFIGNLAFDVTKDELSTHYSQCGEIEHIHMATFEDSGKCKGYAWITFETVGAATSAVNGYILKEEDRKHEAEDADREENKAKNKKKRKWFLNKLRGRELRCEFAEDSTVRYQKRFGKEKRADMEGVHPDRVGRFDEDEGRKRQARPPKQISDKKLWRGKVDARTIKPGAAHTSAQRASQAIVEAQGTKITFD